MRPDLVKALRWIALAGVAVFPAAAADELIPAWRLGAQARFQEAAEVLPATVSGDEARFTRAVLLFTRQPRTAADMDAAQALFAELAASAGEPELRACSLYFLARAEDGRDLSSSPGPALARYEQLWRDYPAQPFGQRALVHLLLLAFYSDEPREAVLARCADLERQAAGLTDPTVRSHFHQVAARGYLHLGEAEASALGHLLQVHALGVARRESQGDLHVSIGQLAAGLDRPALAREHYGAFLEKFPQDPRAYTVRALLAALPGPPP